MKLPIALQQTRAISRRHFFGQTGLGLGSIALSSLLTSESIADDKPWQIPAKAKSIIYLHMAGSPSQLELFDHKPALAKLHNTQCPQEYLEGKRFAFIRGVPKMLGPQAEFKQHGESGQWVSKHLPHLSRQIDDLCVIRSVHTEQFNHSPAQLFIQTGNSLLGYPSMGSWVTYGLGSENKDLPGFVVLSSGGKTPSAGKSLWGSGFLPTVYQGVQCRTDGGDPILFLSNPEGLSRQARRKTLDAIADLNRYQHEHIGDPETITRISQYELSFRMQMSVPEVMDISRETKETLDLYGANRDTCRMSKRPPIRGDFTKATIQRSPTIVCWRGDWSKAACGSFNFTTGVGITMARRWANRLMKPCRSSAHRPIKPLPPCLPT